MLPVCQAILLSPKLTRRVTVPLQGMSQQSVCVDQLHTSLQLLDAGLKPVPSEAPKGPLSYLSTVTTASNTERGSCFLDSLTQQPSDVAGTRSTGPLPPPSTSVTKTDSAVSTARDSSSASASLRRQGSSGGRRSSKEATNGISQTHNQPQTQAGSLTTARDKLRGSAVVRAAEVSHHAGCFQCR
jgi:hypothetical protein